MFRHAQLPPHTKSLHRQKKPGNIPDKRNQRQYGINADSLFGKRNAKQTIHSIGIFSQLTFTPNDFLMFIRCRCLFHNDFIVVG